MSFLKRLVPLKADMAVVLESLSVESGSPFKGTATLEAKEAFRVESARIEVRVTEAYEEPTWERDANGNQRQVMKKKEDTLVSQDVPISQPFEIGAGGSKPLAFAVTVPYRTPTRYGGTIAYSLKAVADVKGRPDVVKAVFPMVTPQAPAAAQPGPAVTQVIQKEVIKVPCKFCGTLVTIDSGVSKCPSCGAPMTIG